MPEPLMEEPARKYDFGGTVGEPVSGGGGGFGTFGGPPAPQVPAVYEGTGSPAGPSPYSYYAEGAGPVNVECREVREDLYECERDVPGTDIRYYDENGEEVGSRAGIDSIDEVNGRTRTKGPEAEIEIGHYVDDEGRESRGTDWRAGGGGNKTTYGDDKTRFEFETGLPDARMVAELNEDTAEVGLQASAVTGGGTLSSHGTDNDRSLHVGVSAGPGGAGRVHYGDDDEDGIRDYGIGFDAGPLSVDVKSEDPVGDVLQLVSPFIVGENVTDALFGGYTD